MQNDANAVDAAGSLNMGTRDIGKTLFSNINPEDIKDIVLNLDEAASRMLKQFGQAREMSDTVRKSMTESVTSVRKLGGDIDDVLKTQQTAAASLGRNVLLTQETTTSLYAAMKVTGVEVGKIVSAMADVGISASDAGEQMHNVVKVARELGVNALAVSEKVVTNMDALNKFNFEGGVTGLAKMAAQATMLRVDMKKTLDLADKMFNPEDAIKTAAALQRLGVTQSDLLDPLRLMELGQNDPAELQNQIAEMSKQFVKLGKDGNFEIAPGAKGQLREIGKELGMTGGEIEKMALAGANLDKKLKEINFSVNATEDDKKLIANMAEKGKDGSYKVKIDGETKNVDDLSREDIDKLIEESKKAPPTIEKLAEEQLGVSKDMLAAIKSSGDLTGLAVSKSETGDKLLGTAKKAITESKKIIPEEIQDSSKYGKKIDEIASGVAAGNLGSAFSTLSTFITDNLMKAFENLNSGINNVVGPMTNTPTVTSNNSSSQLPTNTNNQNTSSATGTNNQNTSSTVNVNYNVNVTANGNNVNTDMVKQAVAEAITNEKTVSAIRDGFEKLYPKKGATQLA
jgi:hypothetical protein